jgi:anthranilate phosphoribosyltransferase
LKDGSVSTYTIAPEQFSINRAGLHELAAADAASSLAMIKSVLANQPGPARDIVILNAGAAIYAAGLADTLAAGMDKAQQALANGAAKAKLEALIAYSNH